MKVEGGKPEPVRLHKAEKGVVKSIYDALTEAKLPALMVKLKSGLWAVKTSSSVLEQAETVLRKVLKPEPKSKAKAKAEVVPATDAAPVASEKTERVWLSPREVCQLKAEALVCVKYDDAGTRYNGGQVVLATYDPPKTKGKKTTPESGSVNITLYRPNEAAKGVTLNISEDGRKLVSLRGVEHAITLPSEKEKATIERLMSKAAAREGNEEKETEVKKAKKAAKPEKKAAVAKPEKAVKAKKASANGISSDAKITILKKGSPFREGTNRDRIYKVAKTGMTVEAYHAGIEKLGFKADNQQLKIAIEEGFAKVS